LDHFNEMLSAVIGRSSSTSIWPLSHGSTGCRTQCLLIRTINRRGAIFDCDHLRYAEIADVAEALRNLGTCGHARPIKEGDYAAFLACLPKSDLLKGARDADVLTRVDHGRSRG
jgi:DNA polymerase-3 subunit epsilon